MKTLIIAITLLTSSCSFARVNGKAYRVVDKQEISRTELIKELSLNDVIIIGEKHYTKEVQKEEARLISDVVAFSEKQNQFSFNWEFLNASSQKKTDELFLKVLSQELSVEEFISITQGSDNAALYVPLIEATVRLGGKLYGGNLSREEKAPVTKGGIAALDPKLLPPGFQSGGAAYLERFTQAMGGHGSPEKIQNYFMAQSLVDDSIAYYMSLDQASLKFLVIGAFHSMYNDGVVVRVKDRLPLSNVANIEIIDSSDYKSHELEKIFSDDKFGDRADYIIFVNEPKDQR